MFSYTVPELRELAREGIDSGPSTRASLADIKSEARRRLDHEKRHRTA